jgi:hypothetical protein
MFMKSTKERRTLVEFLLNSRFFQDLRMLILVLESMLVAINPTMSLVQVSMMRLFRIIISMVSRTSMSVT